MTCCKSSEIGARGSSPAPAQAAYYGECLIKQLDIGLNKRFQPDSFKKHDQCLTFTKNGNVQAAYDGEYLVKQLDIGSGAALASHAGPSKGVIGRALMGAARQLTDKVRPIAAKPCAQWEIK